MSEWLYLSDDEIEALDDLEAAARRAVTPADGADGFSMDTLHEVVVALRDGRSVRRAAE